MRSPYKPTGLPASIRKRPPGKPTSRDGPFGLSDKARLESDRRARRAEFIEAVAEYLTRDLGARSIMLQMGIGEAKEWARLWGKAGLFGYPTKAEAIEVLTTLLA